LSRQRLDSVLVDRGFCVSRQQAQRLIRAGEVRVNQQIIDKPGTEIEATAVIEVQEKPPFVSRGGEKLAKALAVFEIEIPGRVCLDGGISTGGFTDCLLQAGAQRVYGIDVGYGQVDWRLRTDERVVLRERTNLRYLQPEHLYPEGQTKPNLGVVDVSFISLTKVLPALWHLLEAPKEVILLVKPQFEVGRSLVGKKGVVREPKTQALAIEQVLAAAQAQGWQYRGLTWSPLVGPAGNIEFLLWMAVEGEPRPDPEFVGAIAQAAAQTLRAGSTQD
jgi:23S rRNA (cytidine1920-2'-O)/16S rRNA (cytidine1409-2'-O)-methyltransferase